MAKKAGKYSQGKNRTGNPARGEWKDAGEQPRPRLPLLSGGKNPTLAERFEEELHGRKED